MKTKFRRKRGKKDSYDLEREKKVSKMLEEAAVLQRVPVAPSFTGNLKVGPILGDHRLTETLFHSPCHSPKYTEAVRGTWNEKHLIIYPIDITSM